MVWAVVVLVVVLGLGLPAVGWRFTRKPPPLETRDRPRGEIDQWLADQLGLGWRDRSRVQRTVLTGQPVTGPALEAAARALAAQVAADRFRTLRRARKLGWLNLMLGLTYVVIAIIGPILGGEAGWVLTAIAVLNAGLFFYTGTHHAFRNPKRIHRNAELILRSSRPERP